MKVLKFERFSGVNVSGHPCCRHSWNKCTVLVGHIKIVNGAQRSVAASVWFVRAEQVYCVSGRAMKLRFSDEAFKL